MTGALRRTALDPSSRPRQRTTERVGALRAFALPCVPLGSVHTAREMGFQSVRCLRQDPLPVRRDHCPDPLLRVRLPFPGRYGRWDHMRLEDRLIGFSFRLAVVGDILGKSAARAGR